MKKLWESENEKWVIYGDENPSAPKYRFIVENTQDGRTHYPTKAYSPGTLRHNLLVWDFPYAVPIYVKAAAANVMGGWTPHSKKDSERLESQRVRGLKVGL